jgi:hypothetical protein
LNPAACWRCDVVEPSPMVASHEDLPSDDLVRWSVVDGSVSSELLTASGTLEVALSVVRQYHVDIALDERSSAFFFIAVKKGLALGTVHRDRVCFSHVAS